jgi:hypothetical protein
LPERDNAILISQDTRMSRVIVSTTMLFMTISHQVNDRHLFSLAAREAWKWEPKASY